jgi:outer membrane protein OmpA-like peptidoglycan-associated protein
LGIVFDRVNVDIKHYPKTFYLIRICNFMDIIELIKEKLTDSVIEKVSIFLGEHPENIVSALNSSVLILLGGIMRNALNDEDTSKVMNILRDGGHTGEILDDLPNLLENFDKTQLLITIGSNIFNHFAGSNSNSIIEKLSALTGIRKTSASSMVGLAAPLVFGALGKVVIKEGLGVSGLTRLLTDQQKLVFGALPPAIANQLNFKSSIIKPEHEEKPKEVKIESTRSKGILSWIPWVLISLIFLAGLAYFWKYRKGVNPADPTTEEGVFLNQDSIATDNGFSTISPSDTSTNFTNTEVVKPAGEVKTTEKGSVGKLKAEEPKKVGVIKPEQTKLKETPKAILNENVSSTVSDINQQLKSNKSWISLNTNFENNSAEISSKGDLDAVVKYLKGNRNSKITIAGGSQSSKGTLGEDRAYAIREVLLETGVSENQISVQSSLVKDVDAKVVLKVK